MLTIVGCCKPYGPSTVLGESVDHLHKAMSFDFRLVMIVNIVLWLVVMFILITKD